MADSVPGADEGCPVEGEGRTPKQSRKAIRKLHRKLATTLEDVVYGVSFAKQSAYGAAAGDARTVDQRFQDMLKEELGELFKPE